MVPIICEEPQFLVVNKPAGLFSQAASGIDCVEQQVANYIRVRDQHTGSPFIGLPHRLDRGTSGIMLLARNQRALKRFGDQFQSRKVGKFYLAIVRGECDFDLVNWEDFIRKVPDQPRAEIASENETGSRRASLTAKLIASAENFSLLLIHLHTGRMHQIRLQAASRGWALLGDSPYGGPAEFQFGEMHSDDSQQYSWHRFGLHALRLEFRHPKNAARLAITAEIPDYWNELPTIITEKLTAIESLSKASARDSWIDQLAELQI